MKVKFFSHDTTWKLEKDINEFLEQDIEVIQIQMTTGNHAHHVLITYEEKTEEQK